MAEAKVDTAMHQAFEKRHSTRNFSKAPFPEEKMNFVTDLVKKINEHPRIFNSEIDIKIAPNGFGKLGFIVNESGWLFPKITEEKDKVKQRLQFIDIGYLLQRCVMEMTKNDIATCWIGGTYNRGKAEQFCGGNCQVPAVIAFGGDDKDRWVEHVVKFFGSFRGSNEYKDKFYDLKAGKAITPDTVGDRSVICMALNKIPCACKPHAYRIVFDEPQIHIYTTLYDMYTTNGGCFDIGIVIANVQMYIESTGKKGTIAVLEQHPDCPLGGDYICTVAISD